MLRALLATFERQQPGVRFPSRHIVETTNEDSIEFSGTAPSLSYTTVTDGITVIFGQRCLRAAKVVICCRVNASRFMYVGLMANAVHSVTIEILRDVLQYKVRDIIIIIIFMC